jgi:transposase InsO family protein
MKVHANAALGPAGRLALCDAIESGMTLRAAAAALSVSPATAHRWWRRRQAASAEELRSGAWLRDSSSRPRRQPRRLSEAEEEEILRARRQTGLGPGRLAGIVRRARSTIWKVLHRHGLSHRPHSPPVSHRRYEWSRPGALLHVDSARLARFERPGHRVRGRSQRVRREQLRSPASYVFLHCVVDDRSRYAYVEQHPDERAETAAAFMRRAIEHFGGLGLGPPEAVMSDNGNCYRSRAFGGELERVGARQIFTPPYTPRWNGKVERFIQTLKREWAYAHCWPSSARRSRALTSFLRYYNRRRPHSSLGDRPPISVHNVRGQDT